VTSIRIDWPLVWQGVQVRRILIAAVSLLSGFAVMVSAPAAFAADSSTPTLTLTPAMGPPGTHVAISGQLTATQIPVWAPMLATPDIFALLRDLSPGGCELIGVANDPTIHLDPVTGVVTGSFVVGSTGTCVQSDPDAATHTAPPGVYHLSIGCVACEIATFTLTKAAATLPVTGFPIASASIWAGGFLVLGLIIVRGRRTFIPVSGPSETSARLRRFRPTR
jgi:hypothetical protein